jgi:feruloyl esterase
MYVLHCTIGALMRDANSAMAKLRALRGKFEQLLETARNGAAGEPAPSPVRGGRLEEVTQFGANPGSLRMFAYLPEHLPPLAPLVVALHGCGQSAAEYDRGSGWSELADRFGFAVLYPQQQSANNPKTCFSWFSPGDIARDRGEALSIREMIGHACAAFPIDQRKVFVTGLSAGGAMASVMLATYPEVFAGGAIIAGLPYGCAANVQQAFEAMFGGEEHPATKLGEMVRDASHHRGPWPKISVWHGSGDQIVKPVNAENIVRQWIDVHGLSAVPSYTAAIGNHTRRVWSDADGEPVIEAFSLSGLAHGVPLAVTGDNQCGAVGPFFLDAGISSAHHIASFWGLDQHVVERPRAAVPAPRSSQVRAVGVTPTTIAPSAVSQVSFAAKPSGAKLSAAKPNAAKPNAARPSAAKPRPDADRTFDPNRIIAAAFGAAGLTAIDLPNTPGHTTPPVGPGPIIDAALKAAGLKRS